MPTYVYRFVETGETIEIRQSFDDAPLTEAPHPSDGRVRPVKKVFTPVGITFKGSGFYKTDSSSAGKAVKTDSSATKSESSSDSANGSSTSTDAGSSAGTTTGSTGTSSTPSTSSE
jgi:predicted nucleic acid-binding Zn ribbon protein